MTGPTLAELERILDATKRRLAKLHRKRNQIERRLDSVVEKISRIEGADRRVQSFANRDRRRAQNERSLREVVTDLLRENKRGLGLDELSKRVLATGYKTTSTNFKNTLYQTLYHNDRFQLDKESGLYRLA